MNILRNSFFYTLFFLVSCGGNGEVTNEVFKTETRMIVDTVVKNSLSISDKLMDELAVFPKTINAQSSLMDTLFWPIRSTVNDGFALFCKFNSGNKSFVFDRNQEGELSQINAFAAGFLFKDTMNIEYPSIMLRFKEDYGMNETYYYNCWFSYNTELSKYTFNNCFSINLENKNKDYMRDVYISETASQEIKDETNIEVLKILEENRYLY
jgi:hypothetical protein